MIWAVVVSSCHRQEDTVLDEGVAIKLPSLWKTAISDNGELAQVVVSGMIGYGSGNVVVGANKSNQRSLLSLKAQDGARNWEWSDLLFLTQSPIIKDPFYIRNNTFYIYNSLLFFPFSTNTYCVNLVDGTTQWKHKTNLGRFNIIGGIGERYFSSGNTYTVGDDERLYEGNVTSNTLESYLLVPAYNSIPNPFFNGYGYIKGILPFTNQADTLVSLLFTDPNPDTRFRSYSVTGLYNLSKQQWMYERKVLNPSLETGNITCSLLYDKKLYYASGLGLHCLDLLTGEPIWSVPFSNGFGFSGFIIADGRLLANCEDRYTYCLDPATGRQLWKEQSSGTCTPISYLNGVAYFAGGGDGKLHAIDAATGQHLWRVKSPDESVNSGAWFYGVCVAVPGKDGHKGRVVATTGLNAYGYEAIR